MTPLAPARSFSEASGRDRKVSHSLQPASLRYHSLIPWDTLIPPSGPEVCPNLSLAPREGTIWGSTTSSHSATNPQSLRAASTLSPMPNLTLVRPRPLRRGLTCVNTASRQHSLISSSSTQRPESWEALSCLYG
ncbi:hypothetical protein E2C01_084993 [Portunus trituberculatus]|uniref:Uncharacterized protein n=1 Tax=Portunus trituberculatus TaxID=210409 RepID=A0A5B7J7P9_PORTR|nr:hypothetical protein [Portunus trituberculatus]